LLFFVAITLLIYVGAAFGPPPPSETALAWTALGVWLFPFWAGWFDRHRAVLRSEVVWPETRRSL